MPNCRDMHLGYVYFCEGCGFELEVVKECNCNTDDYSSGCTKPCFFSCCGEVMKQKQ